MKKLIVKITALTAFVFVLGLNINSLFIQSDAQSDLTLSSLMNVAEAGYTIGEGFKDQTCLLWDDEILEAPEGNSYVYDKSNCYDNNGEYCEDAAACVLTTQPPSVWDFWNRDNYTNYTKCREKICYYK